MENLKLYHYEDLVKIDSFTYNGTLAVELMDDSKYNVLSPVNTVSNIETVTDTFVIIDTLSNQTDD